ncbi:aspartate aminotransferase family protein [Paraburkholderia tropica]|uniref:4-aminobutyrate aminotransferase n=1 Tax=Paraburkholderia tropica TaxID=92647 RepID=A0AAQ1GKA8_9BURK|nr:aspartate aminotransferase family protein [Paraburkholderia tropica]RQN38322.1 aspartate aminotransferase family protein [Paraburkholderia tropica]SEK07790.1 4-aminobutyrate aminotransferase [Paraburkholderia tropica]
MMNGFDPSTVETLDPALRKLITRRANILGPSYRLFYEKPLHLVRGEGVWMFDPQGKRYLDVYNNVPAVGHCHPRVVSAIAEQASKLNTHTRYLHELILDYAEQLVATFPPELSNVMFTCTGSETNDLALRVARNATGGTGVIVTETAYHGITTAVAEISPSLGDFVSIGRDVRTIPAPATLHGSEVDVAARFAANVRAAADDLRRHGVQVAALVVDTVFSSDGVYTDPAGFLRPALDAIHEAGGLFIADEVQAGFGRVGETMWGFQRHGILPDLVVLGKPMGAGMPIAGLIAKEEVLLDFAAKARYFNTFGGNPVSCAAGLAVLNVIQDEQLMENADKVGRYMKEGLTSLATRYERIGEVRGAGLFIGVDLVTDRDTHNPDVNLATRIVNGLCDRGILIGASGPRGHVLKVRPPLPFSREHADIFLNALDDTLDEQLHASR